MSKKTQSKTIYIQPNYTTSVNVQPGHTCVDGKESSAMISTSKIKHVRDRQMKQAGDECERKFQKDLR